MVVFNQDQKYIMSQMDKLDYSHNDSVTIQLKDKLGNATNWINVTRWQAIQIEKILIDSLANSST